MTGADKVRELIALARLGGGAQSALRTKGRAKPERVEQYDLFSAGWLTRNRNTTILKAVLPNTFRPVGLALVIKIKSNFFGSIGQARRAVQGKSEKPN